VRSCRIGPSRLEDVIEWIATYREVWDARFDALDRVVDELKAREESDERDNRT
jgi:hypothetical protein